MSNRTSGAKTSIGDVGSEAPRFFYARATKGAVEDSNDLRPQEVAVDICVGNGLGDPNEIVGLIDHVAPGAGSDRPALNRLVEFLRSGRPGVLMVEQADRLVREPDVRRLILESLQDDAIEIYDADGPVSHGDLTAHDFDTPSLPGPGRSSS